MASGNAAIPFTPSSSLPANIWVTATATNTLTGDTSEFSNAVSALPITMQFLTASMSVDVSAGSALVHVERTGNLNAIVAVNYATSNGTAVAGQDYSAASGTLTFQAGETDKTFSITILPNPSQAASSVTVNLALSQPTGGSTLGSPSTAILTINNNMPPILQFLSSSYTTYTGSSSSIVTVTRGGGSRSTTVQVHYATAGGSAVAGVDYTPVSGTLTFLANQTMATFTVPILHGGVATVTKTVGLVLSGPTGGAQLGPISTATLTIRPGRHPTTRADPPIRSRPRSRASNSCSARPGSRPSCSRSASRSIPAVSRIWEITDITSTSRVPTGCSERRTTATSRCPRRSTIPPRPP